MGKRTVITLIVAVVAVAAAVAGGLAWRWYDHNFGFKVPQYATPARTTWLSQNWSSAQRAWFHHADQGTLTFGMPYEWLVALGQPGIFEGDRLADPRFLDRFGFIPDPDNPAPAKLPVGFAHGAAMLLPDGKPWLNPQSGAAFTGVGLTCAACHTGRLTYQGQEMLVDGGPALTDLGAFHKAVGASLFWTKVLPWRMSAFEARVLGPNATASAKAQLKAQFDAMVGAGGADQNGVNATEAKNVAEGFGRLDALNRIGNQVFAVDLKTPANYAPTSAPVHFPRIWDAPWFLWVQYNGSIMQPMVRNAGEALGVSARLETAPGPDMFKSGVQVQTLYEIEHQLAGSPPSAATGFTGLRSPRWSDTPLPPIDAALAQRGAALYATHCQECHQPPVSSPEFWTSKRWKTLAPGGERFYDAELIPVTHVGTDPAQAQGMHDRKVKVGGQEVTFGPALGDLVEKTVTHWYDTQTPPTPPAERERMNGGRPNGIRDTPVGYKVRPLDGIWATPPYLHNGSVPTIYALLSPAADRPKTFWMGNREYDPVRVGYRTEPFRNGFLFDTTIAGNSNHGHEFSNAKGPGVIGPLLSDDERKALIEYLKTF